MVEFGHGPDLIKRDSFVQRVCRAVSTLNCRGAEFAVSQYAVTLPVGGCGPNPAGADQGSAEPVVSERGGCLSETFCHDDAYGFDGHVFIVHHPSKTTGQETCGSGGQEPDVG